MNHEGLEERIRRELPHLTDVYLQELVRAVRQLIDGLCPERIYVFGSQARGDANPDSDLDLLVVVPESDLPGHRLDQAAYRAVGWHRVPLDILVMTNHDFERRLSVVASLPATVEREGRLLYAA